MLKKLALLSGFFLTAPILLLLTFYIYGTFSADKVLGASDLINPSQTISSLIREPIEKDPGAISFTINSDYSIPFVIEKYLSRYKSPLAPYFKTIYEEGVNNNIDPRLIVAIAQQESNLGKKTPPECHNAWGWGIHSKGTLCFQNWEEAIKTVTKGIAESYCAKGYCSDPCIMMKKYTPNSNGSWCFGVKQFLREMEYGDY